MEAENAISDEEFLLRWIPESQLVPGEFRVQSEMFRKSSFSVDRQSLKSLEAFKAEHAPRHVARFRTGDCRQLGFSVRPEPIAENLAHAIVTTSAGQGDLRRMARRLRDDFVELLRNDPT